MLDEMKFGEFIAVKRQQANLSMRELCQMTSLSPSFFCKMESGKRPAPSGETQLIIARALNMTEAECIKLFDLAAETKRDGTLPYDISNYINSDDDIKLFLRKAIKCGIKGADLLKLITTVYK